MSTNDIIAAAQRQAELEAAKAAFFASGGRIVMIERTPAGPLVSTTDDPEVVSTIRAHRHLGVIAAARAVHLHTSTVNKIAKRNGIEFDTHTGEKQAERRRTMAPVIRRLLRQGASQSQAAAQLGISRGSLKTIARLEGIELPGRAGE